MEVRLLSCDAPRPDRRAITTTLETIGEGIDPSLAGELTDILLEGSPVELMLGTKYHSTGLKMLRKYQIDYEIM